MEKLINKSSNIFAVICVLLVLWFMASFIEVNAKNTTKNPTYSKYNLFVLLTENKNNLE